MVVSAETSLGARVERLMGERKGTVPGNRGFGLDQGFLSAPSNRAAGMLAVELQEACDSYIPEAVIKSVSGRVSDGFDAVTVTVGRSGG